MVEINREVIIDASLERIFVYLSKPGNLPDIWPSLILIKNERLLPNGGYSFQWEYKMFGMHFKGTGEYTHIVPNQWFTVTIKGNLESVITWTFRPNDGQTRVTFTIEYQTPLPILNRIGKMIIENMNEREADLILANLQAIFTGNQSKNR
ncbi:MAG: hypothetical protein A2Z74_05905 [Chloroflexi bacterium RBG_13_46_9]|nr:MAG: hypothetical protein A2Z74_05905 [Chloroflexi bacterium RBG_13_46_9]